MNSPSSKSNTNTEPTTTNRNKNKAKHSIGVKMPKVSKAWEELLMTGLVQLSIRPTTLNVISRCFILAVSLHNAHLS